MKAMIGYCGLDCEKCDAYLATINNDQALREKTAKLWAQLNNAPILPEHNFERRNIHFYVNVCGFHITKFFNENHPMPDMSDDFIGDGNEGLFQFEKKMKEIEKTIRL